jgi:hypothetical protein
MTTMQSRLKESHAPLVLTPSGGEPQLPRTADWLAKQRKRAEADMLRRELESFAPAAVVEHGASADGSLVHADCALCRACLPFTRST